LPIRFLSERAIYDDVSDTVRVPAVDGNKLVVFAIARAAIMSRLWVGDGSAAGLIAIYRRHMRTFHELARHKYRRRRVEPDGSVLVAVSDLPDLGVVRRSPHPLH
jgi:hypothetical protein